MPKDIYEETPITLAEVKEILSKRDEESEDELSYVQQVTLDYVTKFSKFSIEDTLKLKEELMKKFNLSEKAAIQIVNLHTPPQINLELNIILDKEPITLTDEQKQDLIDLFRSYAEKT
ncbi:MAG: hypothetical protein HWN65_01015 [Candidatus Helarchaeota archaeon]|nr:hypothetical protein [Candidatus Helarchaeota archaeon]